MSSSQRAWDAQLPAAVAHTAMNRQASVTNARAGLALRRSETTLSNVVVLLRYIASAGEAAPRPPTPVTPKSIRQTAPKNFGTRRSGARLSGESHCILAPR